jgi:hypothetical protein
MASSYCTGMPSYIGWRAGATTRRRLPASSPQSGTKNLASDVGLGVAVSFAVAVILLFIHHVDVVLLHIEGLWRH